MDIKLNIPDHFEPPVRRMRATVPEIESHPTRPIYL